MKTNFFLRHSSACLGILLCLAAAIPYLQTGGFSFINYDDPVYVTGNTHVQNLDLDNIRWAFSSGYAGNWHPLTWLSHMLDCRCFGLNPGAHHLTSVLLHVLNTLLLFLVLRMISGALWKSAFVAALFALDPVHVESVAWIAERKDVLCACFWFLTLHCYRRYVWNPTRKGYLWVIMCFVLGLMAKPMLVTLPFILLVLDFWPLRRMTPGSRVTKLIIEKLPLAGLSIVSSIVTFVVQQRGGTVTSLAKWSLQERAANAIVSYGLYLWKIIVPVHLAVFYPHDPSIAWAKVALSLVGLTLITIIAIRNIERRPYILAGWLWYVIALLPVIGIVQVGSQALADRYAYLPSVGIFIILCWSLPEVIDKFRQRQKNIVLRAAVVVVVLGIFFALTCKQVSYWRNSITLFSHAIAVTKNNWLAYNNLANGLAKDGKAQEALNCYVKALHINPQFVEARNNLGLLLERCGRIDEAIKEYSFAARIDPQLIDTRNNLGIALAKQGKFDEAVGQFEEALRIDSSQYSSYYYLGLAHEAQGRIVDAIKDYENALRINPDFSPAREKCDDARSKSAAPPVQP